MKSMRRFVFFGEYRRVQPVRPDDPKWTTLANWVHCCAVAKQQRATVLTTSPKTPRTCQDRRIILGPQGLGGGAERRASPDRSEPF